MLQPQPLTTEMHKTSVYSQNIHTVMYIYVLRRSCLSTYMTVTMTLYCFSPYVHVIDVRCKTLAHETGNKKFDKRSQLHSTQK